MSRRVRRQKGTGEGDRRRGAGLPGREASRRPPGRAGVPGFRAGLVMGPPVKTDRRGTPDRALPLESGGWRSARRTGVHSGGGPHGHCPPREEDGLGGDATTFPTGAEQV